MKAVLKILEKVLETVLFVLMAIMVVVTFAQVIYRFVFSGSFFWAEELAILSMIWTAFLGSALGMRRFSHTRIDFAINKLPPKGKAIVEIIDYALIAGFVLLLAYHSMAVIETTGKMMTTGLKIPRSVMFCSIPTGGILIALYCVVIMVEIAHDTFGKKAGDTK